VLQASGIKVLGMLGGAAKGTFALLDVPFPDDGFPADEHDEAFEAHYAVLAEFIRERRLDGLDLDVEEPMSLPGILRLIDRLHKDFDSQGKEFIITLAPVAAALLVDDPKANLSGFDYEALEVLRGEKIGWYNTQFYCGWGDMHTSVMYDAIVAKGWPSNKVVVGLVTSSENGSGFVNMTILSWVLAGLRRRYGSAFAGVMGWEYFNSEPGGKAKPWAWAEWMSGVLGRVGPRGGVDGLSIVGVLGGVAGEVIDSQNRRFTAAVVEEKIQFSVVDGDIGEEASLPETFEYFTDGSVDS
jgi:chitinase